MNRKLIVLNFFIKLILFLLISYCSGCRNAVKFQKTENHFEFVTYGDESKKKIKNAKKFVELIVSNYQRMCEESNLREAFYDSLSLMNSRNISANYYLSTSREFLVSVFNSKENKFTTFGTEFPVQFYLLQDPKYHMETLKNPNGENFLHFYDTSSGVLNVPPNFDIYIGNIYLGSNFKFVNFIGPKGVVVMKGTTLLPKKMWTDNIDTVVMPNQGICILGAGTDVNEYFPFAKIAAKDLFQNDISTLFVRSEYFKEVFAIDILKPIAKEILIKQQRSLENTNYKYDFVEFSHDKEQLQKKIDSFKIKIKLDDIFNDAKTQLRTGTLLWFYSGYSSFSLQWLLINIFYLILLILFAVSKIKKFPWKSLTLLIISITYNSWIFKLKPQGMDIYYWYPFLFVAFFFYLLFINKKFSGSFPSKEE